MIQITETIRIRKFDELNLVIEILKPVINKKTKEEKSEWKREGYYDSLKLALNGVLKKELLDIPEKNITIENVINEIKRIEKSIINNKEIKKWEKK